MQTLSLEQIIKLNRENQAHGITNGSCNCSWIRNIHSPSRKSPYEQQVVKK